MTFIKFQLKPSNGPLPKTFPQFLRYVVAKSPLVWFLFLLQDIVHFLRYPLAFILFGRIIDIIGKSDPGAGVPDSVKHYLIGIFAILLIGEFAHIWTAHIIVHWKPKLRAAIRSDFLQYTMGHSHTYFQDNFAGAIARKVSEVAESALRLHDNIRFQLLYAGITFIINMTYMFAVSWIFGGALLAFVVLITIPLLLRLAVIRARSFRYAEQRAHVTGVVVDMLTNIPAVKFFSGLAHETGVHDATSANERLRSSKLSRSMVQIENLRRICLIGLGAGMTSLAIYGWASGWVTVGEASSIASLSLTLAGTTWMLGSGIVQLVDEAGNISDALRITAKPHTIVDAAGAAPLAIENATIDFDNVDFGFSDRPVFRDLTLHIGGGEKIALVGPSGAGKSTLIALIMRLYDIDDGSIAIDGQNIAKVKQDSLRDAIAVIPQDTALFHRSLMENIRYGRRGATDAEVMDAAKKAYAHDFIAELPEGYDTLVGERGVRLSGGQRQRIAIARAILKNAPILVLDEATSALDSESERLIQDALDELMVGKTVIAIAHRLSTISRMDRIIVMEHGNIAEEGPHEALVRKRGLYARLWAMQSGGFLVEEGLDLSGGTREDIGTTIIDG